MQSQIRFTRRGSGYMILRRSMKLAGHFFDSKPLVIAFTGLLSLAVLGATNGVGSYSVRIWQTEEGLPQNSVYALAQTPDDYLWVGTREGLARFDGVRFTLPDEKAAPELRHGWITALCLGRDGSLWVGMDGLGVTRVKDGKFSRLTEADGLLSNQIKCLLESSDGSIWIGSEGGVTR